MMLPEKVVDLFGIKGRVRRFNGGRGTTYLVGKTVLKPVDNEEESRWIAETFREIKISRIRLPEYKKSENNKWIEQGWIAYQFISGKHYKKRWNDKIAVCEKFHNSLEEVPCPRFMKTRKDPWSRADRIVWGEELLKCHKKIEPYAIKIIQHIKPISLKNQIIHGDIGGNILFSKGQSPAIIDFSPYYRPRDFALAILAVDALVWGGASAKILHLFKDKKEFNQLLLRAELRRILEIGFCIEHFEKGNIADINQHKNTIELLCNLSNI
ncbi:hypothetical protein HZA97_07990 [Candidatus Woesearchaeota archaeon]|nr:hypothetical protein [Candidatus Woesearchaeota archaeon]